MGFLRTGSFPSVLLAVALSVASWSCGEVEPSTSSLRVAVSIPPQTWLVDAIGGDRVGSMSLVGSGDSPETYQPTDAEVSRVLEARIYLRMGVPFERGPWFRSLAAAPGLEIVDLREGLELLPMSNAAHHGFAAGESGLDPHVWLSPRRLAIQARTLAAALARVDPDHRSGYDESLETTLEILAELDRDIARTLEPYEGRSFFVFHPAWGYLAHDYGLEQVAIEVDGKSPSDAELTRLQERARAEGISTIFVQPQIPGKAAEAIAAAIGGRVVPLDPLATDLPGNLRRAAEEIARSFRP